MSGRRLSAERQSMKANWARMQKEKEQKRFKNLVKRVRTERETIKALQDAPAASTVDEQRQKMERILVEQEEQMKKMLALMESAGVSSKDLGISQQRRSSLLSDAGSSGRDLRSDAEEDEGGSELLSVGARSTASRTLDGTDVGGGGVEEEEGEEGSEEEDEEEQERKRGTGTTELQSQSPAAPMPRPPPASLECPDAGRPAGAAVPRLSPRTKRLADGAAGQGGAARLDAPPAPSPTHRKQESSLGFEVRVCENCDEHIAFVFCEECGMVLCEKGRCDEELHAPRRMRDHTRTRLYPDKGRPPAPVDTLPAPVAAAPASLSPVSVRRGAAPLVSPARGRLAREDDTGVAGLKAQGEPEVAAKEDEGGGGDAASPQDDVAAVRQAAWERWLRGAGIGDAAERYAALLAEQRVDVTMCGDLDHESLKEIGILYLGDRIKVLTKANGGSAPAMPSGGGDNTARRASGKKKAERRLSKDESKRLAARLAQRTLRGGGGGGGDARRRSGGGGITRSKTGTLASKRASGSGPLTARRRRSGPVVADAAAARRRSGNAKAAVAAPPRPAHIRKKSSSMSFAPSSSSASKAAREAKLATLRRLPTLPNMRSPPVRAPAAAPSSSSSAAAAAAAPPSPPPAADAASSKPRPSHARRMSAREQRMSRERPWLSGTAFASDSTNSIRRIDSNHSSIADDCSDD